MADKKILNIDNYAMGWDQFLHTAYAFAKAGRWEAFDEITPVYEGEEFDISIFRNNLRRVIEFSAFDFPQIVPIDVFRQIPRDREWEGFINLGQNRSLHHKARNFIKSFDYSKFEGTMDYFWMLPPGKSFRRTLEATGEPAMGQSVVIRPPNSTIEHAPQDRNMMLILAFTDVGDLVMTKMLMGS